MNNVAWPLKKQAIGREPMRIMLFHILDPFKVFVVYNCHNILLLHFTLKNVIFIVIILQSKLSEAKNLGTQNLKVSATGAGRLREYLFKITQLLSYLAILDELRANCHAELR